LTELARVVGIWRYPVKSMQGEPLEAGRLGPTGLPGDRRWALRDAGTGRLVTAKRCARILDASARLEDGAALITLPDGTELSSADPGVSAALSAWLGAEVRLEQAEASTTASYEFQFEGDEQAEVLDMPCPEGTFLDAGAVHLITGSSLRALEAAEPAVGWELRRFRPSVLLETVEEGFVEDRWVTRDLLLGGAAVYVTMPTVRCAVPMRAQPGLDPDPGLMAALKRCHRALLGVYAAVLSPGDVALGDPLVGSG